MKRRSGQDKAGFSAADRQFMAAAIALARTRLGQTGENPAVGALLVQEQPGGKTEIVGRGATGRGGRPHAETEALAEAGEKARGATLYVTLEPCCHTGKTPPCAQALIAAGVARAVIAVGDPDKRVNGGGIKRLCQAGIKVEMLCLAAEAAADLAPYLCRRKFARPFVTAKLAVSADGFIGRAGEGKIAVSGAESLRDAHALRAAHAGVMIGIGTALADNPQLDCRLLAGAASSGGRALPLPVRIVADTHLRLPLTGYLAKTAAIQPVWLLCAETAPPEKQAALRSLGCRIFTCSSENGRINLPQALDLLFKAGIDSVLLEGGAALMQSFWQQGLADRLILFQSPLILGAKGYKKPDFGSKNGYEKIEARASGQDIKTTWLHLWGKSGLLGAA